MFNAIKYIQEMKDLKSELKTDIRKLDSGLRELEYRLTIKLGTFLVIGIGATATTLKLLQVMH